MSTIDSIADRVFVDAQGVMPGGVSASMRLHPYLDRPLYTERGEGAYLYDLSGKRFIDFNMSNGAALLGHDHPRIKRAVLAGVEAGIITAAETPFHQQLADKLVEVIPAAEKVRFSTVGSEVTIVALRIARAATGRSKYLKFDGHFHGLTEPWLYRRADPVSDDPTIVPNSGGVPSEGGEDVVMIPFNDAPAFEAAMTAHGDELAAVICEPIHYNAGCIVPDDGYLELLRTLTAKHGALLIFDEVLSGFRSSIGGVSADVGVTPDLTTHAKALANGLPLSSVSGREDLMDLLAPTGTVAHSGTYSGFLPSILAAIETLDELSEPGVYEQVNATADQFYADLQGIFDRKNLPIVVQGRGARFGIYAGRREPVKTWSDALGHDHALHKQIVQGLADRGVYFHAYNRQGAPGHAGFSTAHTADDFAYTLNAFDLVVRGLES